MQVHSGLLEFYHKNLENKATIVKVVCFFTNLKYDGFILSFENENIYERVELTCK